MLRLRAPRHRRSSPDDKIIPMINVIFLLLMFFLIAGNLTRVFDEELRTPESRSDARAAEEPELLMGVDGSLRLDGVALSIEELPARLAGADPAPAAVRLRGDARVNAAALLPVLQALRRAGVERVAIVTLRRGGETQ